MRVELIARRSSAPSSLTSPSSVDVLLQHVYQLQEAASGLHAGGKRRSVTRMRKCVLRLSLWQNNFRETMAEQKHTQPTLVATEGYI